MKRKEAPENKEAEPAAKRLCLGAPPVRFWKPHERPWGILSNYYAAEIEIDGRNEKSTEHFYHRCKFEGDEWMQAQISKAATPHLSRELAWQRLQSSNESFNEVVRESKRRDCKVRADWDKVKDDVMKRALLAKFRQHDGLREQLLSTGTAHIVEASPYDSYWGEGKNGKGKNKLGILLKQVRAVLRREMKIA